MKNTFVKLWSDESAQGATEYILLLVVITSVVLIFKDRFVKIIENKVNDVEQGVQQGFS